MTPDLELMQTAPLVLLYPVLTPLNTRIVYMRFLHADDLEDAVTRALRDCAPGSLPELMNNPWRER